MSKKALVYGITRYEPPSPVIEAAVPEAENWAGLLRDRYGFQPSEITLRRDSAVTLNTVLADIEALLTGANDNDQRVVVYAGHGTIAPIGSRMGDEALLLFHPHGADPATAAFTDSKLSALVKKTKPSPDARITFILDCCFAGGFDPAPLEALFVDGKVEVATPLFSEILGNDEIAELTTVHRFASLWDKGLEAAAVDPLVVAACERNRLASQLPLVSSAPPHLRFSGRAIPALRNNPTQTHQQLVNSINPLSSDQRATLLGNVPRRGNKFLN